jgi:hypothetical protein
MLKVSEELLALRTESNRVLHDEVVRGKALSSQADMGNCPGTRCAHATSAVTTGLHRSQRRDHLCLRPDT